MITELKGAKTNATEMSGGLSRERKGIEIAEILSRPLGGLVSGTLVESDGGWCPIEEIRPGMGVMTLDGGLREPRKILRSEISAHVNATRGMLHVPPGALDNCSEAKLHDDQLVMIEHPVIEAYTGEPAGLFEARVLEGFRGIRRVHGTCRLAAYGLVFDDEEIVYANSGILMHCPGNADSGDGFFQRLEQGQAAALLKRIGEREEEARLGGFGAWALVA